MGDQLSLKVGLVQHRKVESARSALTSIRRLSVGNPVLISGGEMAYDLEGLADATRQLMLGGDEEKPAPSKVSLYLIVR